MEFKINLPNHKRNGIGKRLFMIKNKRYFKIFTNWEYVLLIISVPCIEIIEFFFIKGGSVSETYVSSNSLVPYLYFLVFLIIVCRSGFDLKQVGLLIYLILNTLLYNQFSLANNASYLIPYILACSLLILNPQAPIELNKKQENTVIAFYFFIIFFYYYFAQDRLYEDRFYLVGFVIPHQFSYYCAIFTFYLLSKNKVYLAIIATIAGAYVGARSGLIASAIGYLFYFFIINKKQKSSIIGPVIMIAFLIMFYLYLDGSLINKVFEGFNSSSSDDTRTLLWLNMWNVVYQDGIDFINIFGRGPRSSYTFNSSSLGLDLWMHNDLFEILFTLGILGLLIYFYSFYKFYNNYKNYFAVLFLLVLIITNGFFTYIPLTMIVFFRLLPNKISENS